MDHGSSFRPRAKGEEGCHLGAVLRPVVGIVDGAIKELFLASYCRSS